MKHVKLICVLFFISTLALKAQPLNNTTWHGYVATGISYLYLDFKTDTIFESLDGITYSPSAIFSTNGSIFTVQDITGSCPFSYVGTYVYTISIDTLNFLVISDSCTGRVGTWGNFYFIRVPAGRTEMYQGSNLQLFPCPSNDFISIHSSSFKNLKLEIFDLGGRLCCQENNVTSERPINIAGLAPGVYSAKISDKEHSVIKRLVIAK